MISGLSAYRNNYTILPLEEEEKTKAQHHFSDQNKHPGNQWVSIKRFNEVVTDNKGLQFIVQYLEQQNHQLQQNNFQQFENCQSSLMLLEQGNKTLQKTIVEKEAKIDRLDHELGQLLDNCHQQQKQILEFTGGLSIRQQSEALFGPIIPDNLLLMDPNESNCSNRSREFSSFRREVMEDHNYNEIVLEVMLNLRKEELREWEVQRDELERNDGKLRERLQIKIKRLKKQLLRLKEQLDIELEIGEGEDEVRESQGH